MHKKTLFPKIFFVETLCIYVFLNITTISNKRSWFPRKYLYKTWVKCKFHFVYGLCRTVCDLTSVCVLHIWANFPSHSINLLQLVILALLDPLLWILIWWLWISPFIFGKSRHGRSVFFLFRIPYTNCWWILDPPNLGYPHFYWYIMDPGSIKMDPSDSEVAPMACWTHELQVSWNVCCGSMPALVSIWIQSLLFWILK